MALYQKAKEQLFQGNLDWVNDTIKIALFPAAYTADLVAHEFWEDISASEVTGTNYTAGGQALASKAVNRDDPNTEVEVTSANTTFSTLTVTGIVKWVTYKDTGDPATSFLIETGSFSEGAQSPSAQDFVATVPSEGYLKL